MTERNPYSPYNFDSYDNEKAASRKSGMAFKDRIPMPLRNPVFATAALLLTGAAFAGIIIASYPHGSSPADPAPVVTADAQDVKAAPETEPAAGDASASQPAATDSSQGSAVFASVHATNLQESPPVENLLDKEKPIDKLEAFNKQAETMYGDAPAKTADVKAPATAAAPTAAASPAIKSDPAVKIISAADASNAKDVSKPAAVEVSEATDDDSDVDDSSPEKPDQPATAADNAAPAVTHPAGSAPETMAFMKSVLKEKDAKSASVTSPNAPKPPETQAVAKPATKPAVVASTTTPSSPLQRIEPASGAAKPSAITPGKYFAQLSSVTYEAAADKEWTRLRKAFPAALETAPHRVQKADVGAKGTMFRIQAGPMSKDSASGICSSIKAAGKSTGCIVTE